MSLLKVLPIELQPVEFKVPVNYSKKTWHEIQDKGGEYNELNTSVYSKGDVLPILVPSLALRGLSFVQQKLPPRGSGKGGRRRAMEKGGWVGKGLA